MPSPENSTGIVLNSWKEIASYVGRGVRTVQRWESDLGMPVRRPRAKSRSAVVAMSDEIDKWLRSAPTGDEIVHPAPKNAATLLILHQSMAEHSELRTRCDELRKEHLKLLSQLVQNLGNMHSTVQEMRELRTKNSARSAVAD